MTAPAEHWDEDPDYPVEDWKYEVANDATRQGYRDWVASQHEWIELGKARPRSP